MQLVFETKEPMLVIMEKSWFRKMFKLSPKSSPAAVRPETNLLDAETQFNRGLQFAAGAGEAQDYGQAADWYRKAAEQDHALAQCNLGVMYAQGQGVARDAAQSAVWFGRAAAQGDAGAQYHMGRNRERASLDGLAVEAPEARIEAYKWFQLSAAQGYMDSEGAYAMLTFKMTREDVTKANQRVSRFVPTGVSKPLLG
jgi:TPR repeat protein